MSMGLGYIIRDTRLSHSIPRVCDHKRVRSIRKKQLKMRLLQQHKWGAVGSGHARQVVARDTTARGLLVHQNMRLRAVRQTRAEMVKEVRPQNHTYVCSEERTVVHRTELTQWEVRAPQTSAQ